MLGSSLVFVGDDWEIVFNRRGSGVGSLLEPHQGHILAGTTIIYKLILKTFGISSALPFHLVSSLLVALVGVLLFVYASRRVGDWLALMGAALILFFGASTVDLLLPFQTCFTGSVAAALGALIALDRDDRRGDAIACGLLVVSVFFLEVGLAFCVGALVLVLLGSRPWRSRLFVALVPVLLYAVWWAGWGHTEPGYTSWGNLADLPRYVLDAAAGAVGALTGLVSASDQSPDPVGQEWAPALLAVAAALAIWRAATILRLSATLWALLAIGLSFWLLGGLAYVPIVRDPGNGRTLYASAVIVLLIAAELLRGVRVGRAGLLVAGVLVACAVAGNLGFLRDSYRTFFQPTSQLTEGTLSALEIAGPLNPSLVLTTETTGVTFHDFAAGPYLAVVAAYGSPTYSADELPGAPEGTRAEADRELARLTAISLLPARGAAEACRGHLAELGRRGEAVLGPGRLILLPRAGSRLRPSLRRFADDPSVELGRLTAARPAAIRILADRSDRPWLLSLGGEGRARLCGSALGGGAG